MKLPRDVTGPECVKALRRLGFKPVSQRGSHIRLVKDEYRVTVPNHNPIRPGTLASILRQANISLEQFLENL